METKLEITGIGLCALDINSLILQWTKGINGNSGQDFPISFTTNVFGIWTTHEQGLTSSYYASSWVYWQNLTQYAITIRNNGSGVSSSVKAWVLAIGY